MSLLFAKYNTVAFVILFLITVGTSCKKENDVTILTNRAPLANAGGDQSIILPDNDVFLDGSGSTDSDNNIASYLWTKISGPLSFHIASPNKIQTEVGGLVGGVYLFELKVIDGEGLSATDTVQISVSPSIGDNNVIFFFRYGAAAQPGENVWGIEDLGIVLVRVKIDNFPVAEIDGIWDATSSPVCPTSLNRHASNTSFGSFELAPGTYKWAAESVPVDLTGYPVPNSFRQYWKTGPHKAEGTLVVQQGDCIVKEIIF